MDVFCYKIKSFLPLECCKLYLKDENEEHISDSDRNSDKENCRHDDEEAGLVFRK